MGRKENICSREQVERYLLNKMSSDEESLFRQHLEACEDCRGYLNSIRALAGFVADDDASLLVGEPSKSKKTTMRPLYKWLAIACSILLIVGVSSYFFGGGLGNSGKGASSTLATKSDDDSTKVQTPETDKSKPILSDATENGETEKDEETTDEQSELYDLHIQHEQRASEEEAILPVELIFPDEVIVTIDPDDKPLSFKWTRKVDYHLIIKSGDDTIIDTKGIGAEYLPDAETIAGRKVLDWALTLDGEEMKGRVFIVK